MKKVVFKKIEDISNSERDKYGIIFGMDNLFDGVTIREVEEDEYSEIDSGWYVMKEIPYWLVHSYCFLYEVSDFDFSDIEKEFEI